MRYILLVEDDSDLREALEDTLELESWPYISAANRQEALLQMQQHQVGLVVSDVNMPVMDGHQLLASIQLNWPAVPVILMTAYGSIEQAVAAMREGVADYLVKPFEPEVLIKIIAPLWQAQQPTAAGKQNKSGKSEQPLVADPASLELLQLASRVAKSDASVMIGGESGTGKEVLARYIHAQSPRANQPFIALNCAAIPDTLLEATLFGYEKGAFTGATASTPGKFEQADGGTILLDEITEMPLVLQAKLLRILQEQEVERLGGRKIIQLNVRVLATSNRDLKEAVAAGKFREDLYYRLNVFPLAWPPLRSRPGDILPLAEFLLGKHSQRMGLSHPPQLSQAAAQALMQHTWPGNVRELENVVQRALILATGTEITLSNLIIEPGSVLAARQSINAQSEASQAAIAQPEEQEDNKDHQSLTSEDLKEDLWSKECKMILQALEKEEGRKKETADRLGISPRTLRYKLAKMREEGFNV